MANHITAYENLCQRFREIDRLQHAITYLSWDQMVMMPAKGSVMRSESVAELAGISHAKLTAPEVEGWLSEVSDDAENLNSVREMKRTWSNASCLPAELVKEQILTGSACEMGWRTQRGNNDWDGFLKNFKPVVEIARREAKLRQEASNTATPYEAMLALHCHGDTEALIDKVFTKLRSVLPDLLQQVMEKQNAAVAAVQGDYPVENQIALNKEMLATLGFDFEAGRLDQSMHPFSTGSAGDSRITTRYDTSHFLEALAGTAHEVGHASYESQLPEKLAGLPVGESRNMCIHESQSLLFEKQIFFSKAFMGFLTSKIHHHLPSASGLSADDLWRMGTRVEPGKIRTEADEVTYPLHVMLRYEIESALINEDIEADSIPDIWNEKMHSYLGVDTKGDYTNGCMQDIHWTDGAFGYFPSYTIGAVNAAQIFAKIKAQHSDWQDRFSNGDVQFVRDWLFEKIWSKGCDLESQELMQSATGSGTNADALIGHLEARYLHGDY